MKKSLRGNATQSIAYKPDPNPTAGQYKASDELELTKISLRGKATNHRFESEKHAYAGKGKPSYDLELYKKNTLWAMQSKSCEIYMGAYIAYTYTI